ncbi:unnamed protein product [Fraxinus pennsylvanica]|uniref:Uncharacterized protein n=1 Tax=Fraxinus pennsylvanica TaxID=56036 RepID=A0AAD2EAV9_9LAMI|nr:unnamed protein product [Fraxinus pennsylvanica]
MYKIPQKLKSQFGLRQWIFGRINSSYINNFSYPEFNPLFRAFGRNLELALDMDTRAGGHQVSELVNGGVHYDLQVLRAGPIVQFQKGETALPLLPASLHPSANADGLARQPCSTVGTVQDGADWDPL